MESPVFDIYQGYSVSVHLFKNVFFLNKDIIELRIDSLQKNKGKVGCFFRLDALFEPQALEITVHTYTYIYLALKEIFESQKTIQTKSVELTADPVKITDFFDEGTIILILCNEFTSEIPNFSIENYLPHLFLNGFIKYNENVEIEVQNDSEIIESNYLELKKIFTTGKVNVLRISKANAHLVNESFITYLFSDLLQKYNEPVTRFVILYQVIEILITKILHVKIQQKICNELTNLTGHKLVELLDQLKKERNRITYLLNEYAKPKHNLEASLKNNLIAFYVHVNDSDYSDPAKHATLSLTDVFYDYRNKLVHNYRLIHTPGIDGNVTQRLMKSVNLTTEVLIAYIIASFIE